ncbi:hypothetical protein [Candidatus Avelusimicrobium fimicolum]|uniref:hypothetical protein n=1 Tax=Candidatus Avelusimicrobium fimicolum TaxID=3416216 RepID=UPI003D0E97B1
MKKFFYLGGALLLLAACQSNKPMPDLSTEAAAHQILASYFQSNPQVANFFPYLSQCQLSPVVKNVSQKNITPFKTYTCSVEQKDNQRYIAVISVDPKLMGEVDSYKKYANESVYIALLTYEPAKRHLTGLKLLFNIYANRVEKQTEVNEKS